MLIDESLAALNQVSSAAREAADHYDDFAEQLEDDKLKHLFVSNAAAHRAAATAIEHSIRESDELPRTPDPESEIISDVIENISNSFASDPTEAIVEKRIDAEKNLSELINAALKLKQSCNAQEQLESLLDNVNKNIETLERSTK